MNIVAREYVYALISTSYWTWTDRIYIYIIMKQHINLFVGFLMSVGFTASPATAADAEHSLSDFKLGDHVSGEERKLSKLKGKVVVLEYWGTR